MTAPSVRVGDRVWVAGEESAATVLSVDEVCESAVVRVDSDGIAVDASWRQLQVL